MNDQVTKNRSNICAAIAQQAAAIVSDVLSAYWSTSEGEKPPAMFVAQAEERLERIAKLLTVLKAGTQ